jgi:hypothetical protein
VTAAAFSHDIGPQTKLHDAQHEALRIWPVVAITLLAIFAISLPNLVDPILRFDDFPALFAEPEWFWGKTLHEGRWVNYIWHLRGLVTPAWLNFAVYQVLWAVLAAALAVAAMGRDRQLWFVIVLALFILVSASATLFSMWFNTLIPGLASVTLYAVLGCRLQQKTLRALLPFFVIVSFSAYPTYPLTVLAMCLMRTENRSLSDLFGLVLLFVLSFAGAVLLTYTLNWQVHGVFGVPLAAWREATPAADMAGMIANLPFLGETFKALMVNASYSVVPVAFFHMGMLVGATLVMIRMAPREALYLHAGLWVGMALVVLQILKLGVVVPPRAFIFAWVFYAVIVVRATALLSRTPGLGGRMARNFTLLILLSYMVQTFTQYASYRPWQAETRAMAQVVETAPDGPVLVYGDVMTLSSAKAAGIQSDIALTFRMQQITGRKVILCHTAPEDCAEVETFRPRDNKPPALRVEVMTTGEQTHLNFPQGY